MPSIEVQFDKGTEYRFHREALRQNRSLSEIVRVCAELGLQQSPPPTQITGDAIAQNELRNDKHKVVGAYLSEQLSRIVDNLATQQRKSKSRVVADLLRAGLEARGSLPTTVDAAA
jgi:hypothetical protein